MKEYSSYDIQNISSNFRNIARRLSRTDYSQCDTNLKRFISEIENEELISQFIKQNNTCSYDIQEILRTRGWLEPFTISPEQKEEISFSVQILKYAVQNFDGDFTRLYGTYTYTGTKSTVNDEMRKFIDHIIDPLIDHISEYLRYCYDEALKKEEAEKNLSTPNFTAQNSTVVIGSQVGGNISNTVSITEQEKLEAKELITAIKAEISDENIPNKKDIEDILLQVKSEIDAGQKPKKGLLTALKVLCNAGSVAIPLITALIELFNHL